MDEKLEKKRNICKSMGGEPMGDRGDNFHCDGVDEFKFRKEAEKED